MGSYLMEIDAQRGAAGARMVMGSGFPDVFASVLCMHNAASPKYKQSLVLASIRNNLAFPEVSSQMRRLFGPRASAVRQDVLAAADLDTVSEEEDYAAWVAYRKARKDKKGGRGADDRSKTGRSKPKEEGRTTDGFKRKTGDSNRRYTCNIEFHYASPAPKQRQSLWRSISEQKDCEEAPQSTLFPYRYGINRAATAMESPNIWVFNRAT